MQMSWQRNRTWRRSSVLVLALCAFAACSPKESKAPSTISKFNAKAPLKARILSAHDSQFTILINQGSPEEAAQYALHIEEDLGVPHDSNLDALLQFCGYSIAGHEIEITSSADLMARFPGDIVASRFFAPKIIDVSDAGAAAETKSLGWRKVVRLKVKAGSPAAAKGISMMFLLFNVFQNRTDVAKDPFAPCAEPHGPCSQNNQAMLIVGTPLPGKDTAYWLVFENAAVAGGKRTDNLRATFDGGDVPPDPGQTAEKPYYLPVACAQCHGDSVDHAKLNYLDSDHWNDRIQEDDDFSILKTDSANGVVFDGGRDTASTSFQAAFASIRTLNTEIRDQVRTAGASDGNDFSLRAVDNWLRLHNTNANFLSPIDRAIPPPSGNPNARVWKKETPHDEELLKLLNRFCFRCHSSVIYHVFDKEAVFRKKGTIRSLVNAEFMPQDRRLKPKFATQVANIIQLVTDLQ